MNSDKKNPISLGGDRIQQKKGNYMDHSIPFLNFSQTPNIFHDYWQPRISAFEFSVLSALSRKIFGWHKTSDAISINQLIKCTGLSENTIKKSIKKLIELGLVIKINNKNKYGGDLPSEYSLNIIKPIDDIYTDHDLEKEKTENQEGEGGKINTPGGHAVTPPRGHAVTPQKIDLFKYKKESTPKKKQKVAPLPSLSSATPQPSVCASYYFEAMKKKYPNAKTPLWSEWEKLFEDFMQESKHTEEEIKKVIDWLGIQTKAFWTRKLLNPKTFIKNFPQGLIEMKEIKPNQPDTPERRKQREDENKKWIGDQIKAFAESNKEYKLPDSHFIIRQDYFLELIMKHKKESVNYDEIKFRETVIEKLKLFGIYL